MKKNTCIKAFSAILALTLSLGLGTVLSTKKASADEIVVNGVATQGFYVRSGASVYVGDDNSAGIKYETYVTKAFQSYLETTYQNATFEWHTLITGTNMITNNDVTQITPALKKPESVGENAGKLACQDLTSTLKTIDEEVTDLDADGKVDDEYAVSIVYNNLSDEEKAQHGKADLIARSYVLVTKADETTEIIYSKAEDTVRNMRAVAYSAIRSGGYKANETALWKYTGVTTANVIEYDSETDNTGVIDVAELSTTGSYDVYCGAKELTVSAVDRTNGQITVGDLPTNLVEGKVYDLVLYSNTDNSILTQPFIYATKVLRTLADLEMFIQTNGSLKALDGYYVLGNDINATGEKFAQLATIGNDTENRTMGLTGTFDGNGYTIDGLTITGRGLFYTVAPTGVVKNLALTNVALGTGAYTSAIAGLFCGAIENSYIQVSSAGNGNYSSIFAQYVLVATYSNITFKNVVLDTSACDSVNTKGALTRWISTTDIKKYTKIENFYVISSDWLSMDAEAYRSDAENRVTQTKNDGTAIANNVWYGVKRYDSVADWKENKSYDGIEATENDYNSFTGYWTEKDGVPVWTGNPNK